MQLTLLFIAGDTRVTRVININITMQTISGKLNCLKYIKYAHKNSFYRKRIK